MAMLGVLQPYIECHGLCQSPVSLQLPGYFVGASMLVHCHHSVINRQCVMWLAGPHAHTGSATQKQQLRLHSYAVTSAPYVCQGLMVTAEQQAALELHQVSCRKISRETVGEHSSYLHHCSTCRLIKFSFFVCSTTIPHRSLLTSLVSRSVKSTFFLCMMATSLFTSISISDLIASICIAMIEPLVLPGQLQQQNNAVMPQTELDQSIVNS